jgi:hypothetical protein
MIFPEVCVEGSHRWVLSVPISTDIVVINTADGVVDDAGRVGLVHTNDVY